MKSAPLYTLLAATSASAFIIPSTISAPEFSVTAADADRIINDVKDSSREAFTDFKEEIDDIIKAIESKKDGVIEEAFYPTTPRPDAFEEAGERLAEAKDWEHGRVHIWAGHPPPPVKMLDCEQESGVLSKMFCEAKNKFTSLTAPAGPRRHRGCHRPRPDMPDAEASLWQTFSLPGMSEDEAKQWRDHINTDGLVPPPSPPPGFPKPKGGPLKFWPRPDGPGDREDVRPPYDGPHSGEAEPIEAEPLEGGERDWDAFYGRPHPHHHHDHHHHGAMGAIAGAFHFLVFGIPIPVAIGVAAGLAASVSGMIVGTAVAWLWVRFVRGNKRGNASGTVSEDGSAAVSEKVGLLGAEDKEREAGEAVVEEELPIYVQPPVYVEKA